MSENKKKSSFSKLKNIGSMDIKDIKSLFSKEYVVKDKTSIKKIKAKAEKSRNIIAFDIGTNSIKMVDGKFYKDKLSINKLIEVPTPEGAIADGQILNALTLKDEIAFALKGNGIRTKDAICTTNSSLIINREVIIPQVEEEEMETVIRYEIQQYLPINLDDYIIQYTILDEILSDTGAKLKLNVISYPKKIANNYYELLLELDLKPYALDVNYNSINKLSNYGKTAENEGQFIGGTVAFIDMGATSINVTIFKNGKLDFTRIIKAGGFNIDYALSQSLDMSVKATESQKINKGNLENIEENDTLNLTIRDAVDELIEEIERLLQFYSNKSAGSIIEKVFIYGGTSNIKGLDLYMAEKLNKNVISVSKLDNVDISTKNTDDEPICEYLNAIGSIIRL
ncbi:Cell division protein FtsA [Clostridium vincentii]|uniref:Cell division protein FtsA n=1 Tax=Clostridium vincentii TaxID=52704 RepID=A0A2T0BC93_9CLOT|nr:Cell division protein FtsA [Clostridium vincentii]